MDGRFTGIPDTATGGQAMLADQFPMVDILPSVADSPGEPTARLAAASMAVVVDSTVAVDTVVDTGKVFPSAV